MGFLGYAGTTDYEFDDRTLAHVKIAVTAKLRLQESFLLNWVVPVEAGSGRVSIWLHPSIPLTFQFREDRPPALNRVWLDALARSAHGLRGMEVMPEQDAEPYLHAAGAPAAP